VVHDTVIVGAGIAGLSLARELRTHGRTSVVLERARGVGGRCATRRIEGQPVDHGLAFLHGRSAQFLAALSGARDGAAIEDWPRVRQGTGVPCQPQSFDPTDTRFAPAVGVSSFAKHLALGLDLRLESHVESLTLAASSGAQPTGIWEVELASGEHLRSKTVALTMPAPSVLALLRNIDPPPPALASLLPVLRLIHVLPCLTVIARYPTGTPIPPWEASYPQETGAIHTILHDSSKRPDTARIMLVIQARPAFSQAHLDTPPDTWARTLLEEAAFLHGEWVGAPDLVQPHRWRNARVAPGSQLASPLVATCDDGAVLGIAGDGLHAEGGVEGAYLSGIALAARLMDGSPLHLDSRKEPSCH
jgi:predicted NAD/FAD-dependent oxidoreductase